MLITLLATVVVLGVLIFVHELGHFAIAKWVDIEVPRFSIGLGPKMAGIRWGETEYVISWLPLGGYVKMAGMGEEEALGGLEGEYEESGSEPSPRDFDAKPLWARSLTISGGVLMNFLFAVFAFAFIALAYGIPVVPDARIGGVLLEELPPEGVALARITPGSEVRSVAGRGVSDWGDLERSLLTLREGPATLEFTDASPITVTIPADDSARVRMIRSLTPQRAFPPLIGSVREGGPAEAAGLRAGDLIREVDGQPVPSWQDLVRLVEDRPEERLELLVGRGDEGLTLEVTPDLRRLEGERDTLRYGRIGVAPDQEVVAAAAAGDRERAGPIRAAGFGFSETWMWTSFTIEIVRDLLTGRVAASNLGGPVLIGQQSGEMARAGLRSFLWFMAIISINLAILNLLPIPVLDGGHLVFLAIEAVRGKAVTVETRVRWTQVGLFIVAAIMVWAIGNDVLRLLGG